MPTLYLITGLPASGKTTLARALAARLGIPLVARDALKEILFDTLGWSDRAWSRKLGAASYELLFHLVEQNLAAGQSVMAESNFNPAASSARVSAICQKYNALIVQVVCHADGAELLRRFKLREETGERHPGHVGLANLAEAEAHLLTAQAQSLDVPGRVIWVNTTDLSAINPDEIARKLMAS